MLSPFAGIRSAKLNCRCINVVSSPACVAAGTPESCEGLDNIIANIEVLQCQRNDDCLSLDCDAIDMEGFGAVLYLFPCDRPPAIELISKTPLGNSSVGKFNSSQTRTTVIDLGNGTEFQTTISWITNQTASISVCFYLHITM